METNYKNNSRVIDTILLSILDSDLYLGDYERLMAIQTLQYVVDKFDLNYFFDSYNVDKDEYNKYFKDVVKTYYKEKHKEYKKLLKNEKNTLEINHLDIDRKVIFESIYENNFYDTDYKKMKVINTLQFFFDKFKLEIFIQSSDLSEDDYKQYFQKNIQTHNQYLDTKIIEENYTNKGE
ncbi:MAG: hypothetical protein NTW78_06145 [Campylobacterales bacterium]|nr:hypothetical protein [Campylobacterales bacterium]